MRTGRPAGIMVGMPGALARPWFRRPVLPAPLESFELRHPRVPAGLDGLRILHLADLHMRAWRRRPATLERLLRGLAEVEVDLAVFTGDAANLPPDEEAGLEALARLAAVVRTPSRDGAVIFAVRGNHDRPEFVRRAEAQVAGVRWLRHEVVAVPGLSQMRLLGSGFPERVLEAVLGSGVDLRAAGGPLVLGLVHTPTELMVASDVGMPMVLAGHTHGGQVRLHAGWAPHTSCDMPPQWASGLLQRRETLMAISRGLGEAVLPVRWRCPAHAPVYTLRRGALSFSDDGLVHVVRRW